MNPHGSGYGGKVHRDRVGVGVRQSGFRRGLGGRGRVAHGVGGVRQPVVRRGGSGVHAGVRRPVVRDGGGEGSGGGVIGDVGGGSGLGRTRQQVSVWWDIDNCKIPHDVDSHTISCNILYALEQIGYHGRVSIFAYGNSRSRLVNLSQQNALNSKGITFIHVPPGTDATDRRIMVDMMFWAFDNPSPATYLVISGDTDFWPTMKTLKTKGYTIMMASHPHTYTYTIPATTIWDWSSLAKGGWPLVDLS